MIYPKSILDLFASWKFALKVIRMELAECIVEDSAFAVEVQVVVVVESFDSALDEVAIDALFELGDVAFVEVVFSLLVEESVVMISVHFEYAVANVDVLEVEVQCT